MDFESLRKALHDRKLVVKFRKVNGDLREMTCTTNLDLVPPSSWPTGKNELSEEASKRTIRVYDTNAQGWRSFIFDNIIEVTNAP
jgi:hypothetical protein